ncbi:hypothetical protein TNCV_3635301 [Trichonephila clavipes]|nr:hypothetical protein TNCV_3635301 [Trichonephila clavipes]
MVLVVFALDRWCHDSGARWVWFGSRSGSPMKKERFVLGTFRSERMRVLYRSRLNDRLRVICYNKCSRPSGLATLTSVPLSLGSNPGEDMDVCSKCIVPLWHGGTLNSR